MAPVGENRPDVYFESVDLEIISQSVRQSPHLGALSPGQTIERQFNFDSKELATVEFRVSGNVNPIRLFQIKQKGRLPEHVVRPLLREFGERFESIGVKEPMAKALALIPRI